MAETSKPKQKNKRQKTKPTPAENQAAEYLEDFLFGEGEKALEDFGKERGEAPSVADLVRGAISKEPAPGQDTAKGGVREQREVARVAWEDPQDLELQVDVARGKSQRRKLRKEESETTLTGNEYVERLRLEHARLHPQAKWSELPAARRARKRAARQAGEVDENEDEDEDEDEEEEIDEDAAIRSSGNFVREAKTGPLPPGQLEASRLKDANFVEPSKAVVRSVQFHANAQLMLTAGLDRTLRLFNIDGRRNDKVQGVHTEDMPIHQASFSGDGKQVIMSGRRKWFYIYDLPQGRVERVNGIIGREERSLESFVESPPEAPTPLVAFFGNDGHIPLVSLKSRQCIGTLKMNGAVRTGSFAANGHDLLTSGSDGTVYMWDIRTQRCLGRSVDDGCLNSTALQCAPDGAHVATGSDSGVVNIYKQRAMFPTEKRAGTARFLPGTPVPEKILMNLTTKIDSLAFSPDSQILAMSSTMKKDSLRLVHLPSYTVFSNWPTSKTPLHFVSSLAFSPGGGYLAIGNAKGRVLLYRLHHYSQA